MIAGRAVVGWKAIGPLPDLEVDRGQRAGRLGVGLEDRLAERAGGGAGVIAVVGGGGDCQRGQELPALHDLDQRAAASAADGERWRSRRDGKRCGSGGSTSETWRHLFGMGGPRPGVPGHGRPGPRSDGGPLLPIRDLVIGLDAGRSMVGRPGVRLGSKRKLPGASVLGHAGRSFSCAGSSELRLRLARPTRIGITRPRAASDYRRPSTPSFKDLQGRYAPTYENQSRYDVLVEETVQRMWPPQRKAP